MLMMSCCDTALSGWLDDNPGSASAASRSSSWNLVATRKNITRKNSVSISGSRFTGSSISPSTSRIRMAAPVDSNQRSADRGGLVRLSFQALGHLAFQEVVGELQRCVVHRRDIPLDL